MKPKANLSLVRNINSNLILKYVLRYPDTTIPEISKATKLSLPTVTRTINKALEEGLINATDKKGDFKGRKAQCYAFNGSFCRSLLMMVKEQRLLIQVVTISGMVVRRGQFPVTNDTLLKKLDEVICNQLKSDDLIKNVCITLSAHTRDGFIYASHAFPCLNGVDLQQRIESAYAVRAVVMDSVKALPFSCESSMSDYYKKAVLFLSFELEDGCGSAISVRGKTFPGTSGAFGELYYLPLKRDTLSREELYIYFTRAMLAVINPDVVVFYIDESAEPDKIMAAALADFPEYAQPKMYIGAGLIQDNFEAMKNIAFDLVLDNI